MRSESFQNFFLIVSLYRLVKGLLKQCINVLWHLVLEHVIKMTHRSYKHAYCKFYSFARGGCAALKSFRTRFVDFLCVGEIVLQGVEAELLQYANLE